MNDYNTECRAIVMEYLLHYCYKDTAKALLNEMQLLDDCSKAIKQESTSIPVKDKSLLDHKNIDWNQIDARKSIHSAIKRGDIAKAFALIETHFPNLIRTYDTINRMDALTDKSSLPKLHYILYKLRCQQFIETLRNGGDIEAIQFAQYYLRPCSKIYSELTNSVTSLIAYTDMERHDESSQQRRDSIADEVNEMILESQHFSPQATMEKLWRQKTVIQVELDNQKRKASIQDQQEAENTKIPM